MFEFKITLNTFDDEFRISDLLKLEIILNCSLDKYETCVKLNFTNIKRVK